MTCHSSIPVFDAHCDTLSRIGPDGVWAGERGQWSLEKCGRFRPQAQIFALFFDVNRLPGVSSAGGEGIPTLLNDWQRTAGDSPRAKMLNWQLTNYRTLLARHPDTMAPCRTGAEALAAIRKGKLAAFLSVEGGELLDCDCSRLEWAWEQGVRVVNLTWNHANELSGSCVDEAERGLSERGRAFIRRMGELGMIPDVSHLSEKGFWDLYEMGDVPLFASHSNSKAVFFHARGLTDAQFAAIIEKDGVAGLNAYADFLGNGPVSTDTVIAHLEHFLSLGGEKNVALGGDWDGCSTLPQGWTGVWDWGQLYDRLLQRNYPQALLDDLFFNNLMRMVIRICII